MFKLKKEEFLSLELVIEEFWSGKRDSNPRPLPWQGNALPAELFPQQCVFKLAVSFFLSTMSLFFLDKEVLTIFLCELVLKKTIQ